MKKTFVCVKCCESFREGMDVETSFYLGADPSQQGQKLCVYCYNKRTMHKVDPAWFIAVANRLEHEEEIKEAVELYIPKGLFHEYATNAQYELVIRFYMDWDGRIEAMRLRDKLVNDGFICSEERRGSFTVNFSGKYERHFRR